MFRFSLLPVAPKNFLVFIYIWKILRFKPVFPFLLIGDRRIASSMAVPSL